MLSARITDCHPGHRFASRFGIDERKNLLRTTEDILRRGAREVVCTGDLAEPHPIGWFHTVFRKRGITLEIVWGNHDNPKDLGLPAEERHAHKYYHAETKEHVRLNTVLHPDHVQRLEQP